MRARGCRSTLTDLRFSGILKDDVLDACTAHVENDRMILDDVDQVRARILLILGLLDEVTNAGLKLPEMFTLHVKYK